MPPAGHHLAQGTQRLSDMYAASAAAAAADRGRVADMLILCLGIGVGVLLYALMHDLVSRGRCRQCTCQCSLSPPGESGAASAAGSASVHSTRSRSPHHVVDFKA